jgi:predicted Zn-ribbon and HTH transcriptional regulator
MGFLDDLGKSLNKVGKKTSEMAGVAKIKLEITKTKGAIDKKFEELGSRVYLLDKEGASLDEQARELINDIDALYVTVKELEAQINEASNLCKKCGERLAEDAKFCGKCGETVNDEPIVEKKCPNCGAEVGEAKFCNSCGTSIE